MTAASADGRSRAPLVPWQAIAATVLFAGAIVLLSETLATSDQPTHAVVWGGLALAALAFAFLSLVGAWRGPGLGLTRWRLGSWFLLWYGVAFGLATMTWSQPQTGVSIEIDVSAVLRALWLVAVGMVLWVCGYFVGPGRLARERAGRLMGKLGQRFSADVRGRATPWILYVIGAAARTITAVTTGRFGYLSNGSGGAGVTGYGQFLAELSYCAPFAIMVAALQVYRERTPGARVTLTFLFLAELAFSAAAGGKQGFVIAVLAVVIPFSAARRRLPRIALVAFPLIFLVAAVPFNRSYRSAVNEGSPGISQELAAAPSVFREAVVDQSVFVVIPHSVDYLLKRIREIDSPAIIMQRTPRQIAFASPVQLVEAPMAEMIPRVIWPGKPVSLAGDWFSQGYYELPSTSFTASALTPVGGLYQHGGWIPVIAGMFFLGVGVRLLDDILDARTNPHAALPSAAGLPDACKERA